jgi:hypothetical protein
MGRTSSTPLDQPSDPPPPPDKLKTIRQMLATIETLTMAGQRHLMAKVVAQVAGEVDRALHRAAPGDRRTLIDQVAQLSDVADRQFPSVTVFRERANRLIALLATDA